MYIENEGRLNTTKEKNTKKNTATMLVNTWNIVQFCTRMHDYWFLEWVTRKRYAGFETCDSQLL